jgi:hypothetical protein
MKIAFFLLIPFLSFSQITQRDTVVSIGGTLYLQRYTIISEPVLDTLALRARINEIDAQISLLNIEKEKKKSLIAAFEELKPLGAMKRTTKQPARKPKKKKQ